MGWSVPAFAVACAVAACGSSDSGGSGAKAAGGGSSFAGKKLSIVMPESVPGYAKQIGCGAYEEGKQLGFDVGRPQAPSKSQDAAEQAQVLQSVLARNPAGLIFSAADPQAGGVAIKPAVSKGLPVVAVDVALADPSLAISFVSSSHEQGGKLGGELLAKQIGERGQVLAIGVIPSNPITQGRIKGFKEAMAEFPDIDVVAIKYPDLDINKIAAEASALLNRYPNLKGIYTTNDTIASSVATALRQSQKVGKVKVITWDLQPAGIKLLQEGSVTGTVVQRPREEGRIAVQQLANKLSGKPVTKSVTAPLSTATNDQINDPAIKALYYSNPC
ncbi:MAG TPA: substrate-binding domain-containing protein [Baekduia sp.]|uniref:substrate-binding domain-containing protein n=1 Tax=Baekduia sp. TaxID=2600305 RepID=UPI002D766712|nr:substrate-binding domain-containing protein [Baekduia sp.]HET6507827.1 substrate-binding domain-containing protein [Baekduia sp.]